MFAHILEVLNEDGPMVDFYSTKPSVKAKRKRTCKPKGKTGQQQPQAEATGEALAPATPTPPNVVQTPQEASSSLPLSTPTAPTSPPPPDAPPIEEEEIEFFLEQYTLPPPLSFIPPVKPITPAEQLTALQKHHPDASVEELSEVVSPSRPTQVRRSTRQPIRGSRHK